MSQDNEFRLLVAEGHGGFRQTLVELLEAARGALPIVFEAEHAATRDEMLERMAAWQPDAVLLDWNIAGEATPACIEELRVLDPEIRIVAILPGSLPEYRRAAWNAGACAGIPREKVEVEWLATAVCIMQRAKQREAGLRRRVRQLCPVMAEVLR